MRVNVGGVALDLTDDQVEDLRWQLGVVTGGSDLIDAAAVAKCLGVSREHVYEHAEELGGQKIGNGPKSHWRFDPAKLRSPEVTGGEVPARGPSSRRQVSRRSGSPLLEVRGSDPYAA